MVDRTRNFSVRVVRLARKLPKDPAGYALAGQLIRSATSVGANFREAQHGRTRNEFVSKLTIALQEAEEARYWLQIVGDSGLGATEVLEPLIGEASEFIAILVATIRTTKRKDSGP